MPELGRQGDRYIPVLISLHDRLIDNLLQLCILVVTRASNSNVTTWWGVRTFRLFPTIILSTRKSSPFEIYPSRSISYTLNATVHAIKSERGRGCPFRKKEKTRNRKARGRTTQLLLPPTTATKRAQATDELLKVDGAPATGDSAESSQSPARCALLR